jgi:hypothetical protein
MVSVMSPRHSGSLSTVDSSIWGLYFIKTKGYWWSNLGHWSRHGRLRWGWQGGGAANGGTPRPRRWLAGAGRSVRYGAPLWRGLTLRTWRIKRNSPRGSSNGGVDQSTARDGGQLAPIFGDVDDELQRSVGDEIRLRGGGVTHRRATWCWLNAAGSPTERRWARAVARVSIFEDQNSS